MQQRHDEWYVIMDLKITPLGQTIVKPTALGSVANTDTKLLIYGLFQKDRVLAQDDRRPDRCGPRPAPPLTLGQNGPARQLDRRLPQLAHDLLSAVSLLRHFDLPSKTQIMRLHLDPFQGVRFTPANKLPCVQFSIDTNGKFTVVANKRPDQGPFLIGQSPDGGYDAFRSLAFKRVQVRIFDQLGRCESGSVDGCGCLRSQSPNRAEQMPRGKLPDTEAGRLTLPWPLGRRR